MSRALFVTVAVSATMVAMVVFAPIHCQPLAGVIAVGMIAIATRVTLVRQQAAYPHTASPALQRKAQAQAIRVAADRLARLQDHRPGDATGSPPVAAAPPLTD